MIDRKLPAIVIHLLLDNCTRQNICAIWNGAKSHTFTAMNGECQGGVLSPLLFNVYFDEMIHKLEKGGIVCKIGIHYIGPSAYADDVILLCHNRYGLEKIIRICEEFGVEFRVTFNAKKTQCIKFGLINDTLCKPVTLNNKMINWKSNVNHLGNMLNQKLEDGDDLQKRKAILLGV